MIVALAVVVVFVLFYAGLLVGCWWNASAYDRGYRDGYRFGKDTAP